MVKIGLEGDKRRFPKAKKDDYDVTKNIPKPITKWPRCEICGLEIKGKAFRGSVQGKFVDFRCWNEGQG